MKSIGIALCCMLLTGCNSLFYHPDKISYSLPEQLSNNFTELRIPVGQKGEPHHAWHLRSTRQKKDTIVHFHGNAQNMTAHVFFVAWRLDEGEGLVEGVHRAQALGARAASKIHFRTEPNISHTACMYSSRRSECMDAIVAFLDDKLPYVNTLKAENQ